MKSLYTLCLGVLALAVQAQDTTYVNKEQFILDETVVSANRWEQNIREVPNRISKMKADLIQFQNPQTAADLLGFSNQVFIQKSQLGGGSPMIRGFATNRVLLVIDGVRMNNAIFRSGNLQNVISLDANSIQEAEVIFGPGSVIYGSDAIGGVMDFHTLTPKISDSGFEFHANGLSRFSSANQEYTNHFNFSLGMKKLAFVTSFTRSVYDDLRMGSNGPDEYLRPDFQKRINGVDTLLINSDPQLQIKSGYSQNNFLQKIHFQPGENISLTYAFHYSKTSNTPRYDRLILRNSSGLTSSEWYYGPQQWLMHSLQATLDKSNALWNRLRITLAYQEYDESRHNRNFGAANRTNRFENVKATSVNLDADKSFGETTLFYGAEYVTNTVGSSAFRLNVNDGSISNTTTRYPDGSTWNSLAAYASAKRNITDRLLINASARVSHVNTEASFDPVRFPDFPSASLRNTAINGSVGVVLTPAPAWKLYTNLSTGFRAPNVDDIGKVFDSQPGDVVVPNPELDPEYAYNAEIGAAVTKERFSFDVAYYYTVIDNAIARSTFTFNGQDSIDYDGTLSRVLAQQNISSVKVYGVQVGLLWKLDKNWQVTSHLNWQQGRETYPNESETYSPTHVAPLFGSSHIIYTNKTVKIDLYANYNGRINFNDLALSERADSHLYAKDSDGNPYAPEWGTLNVKASFQASKVLTVDAGFENILDKRYRPYSSGITAPGRNAIVALRIKL
jgi:hemoglobin/transferrin/lactoferrin receptor protein